MGATKPVADSFLAATWNVFNQTPRGVLEPILGRLLDQGVSLFLMQEVKRSENRQMLEDHGLEVVFHPDQYVIAYDPRDWVQVTSGGVRLAQSPYYPEGGHKPVYSEAALAILSDRAGRTLTAMSYHTPSAVQRATKPPNRILALRQSADTWKQLAAAAETRSVLFGGDDNVDERLAHGPWDFMLQAATGLKLIQAPRATHGDIRRIDDFRIRGLRAGTGRVLSGGGDHRVHVREFAWI